MKFLIFTGFVVASFIISIFAFSNIFLPIFYTIPRLRKEKRQDNLRKKVPLLSVIWAPISWSVTIVLIFYFSIQYFPNHRTEMVIGICLSLLGLFGRIGKQNADMDQDFRRTYGDYLKSETDSHKSSTADKDTNYKERISAIAVETLSKTGVNASDLAERFHSELGMEKDDAKELADEIMSDFIKDSYNSKIQVLRKNFSEILNLDFRIKVEMS